MYELCSRLRAAEFGGRSGMPSLSTSRMELCPCVGCITFLNTLSVSWTSVEENEHISNFNLENFFCKKMYTEIATA